MATHLDASTSSAGIFTSKWSRLCRLWQAPWCHWQVMAVAQAPGALKQQRYVDEDHHSSTSQEGIKSSQFEHWFLPSWSMWTYWRWIEGTETLDGFLPLFSLSRTSKILRLQNGLQILGVCSLSKCAGLGFGYLIGGMKSMLPRRFWFATHCTRLATCHPFLSMSTGGKCFEHMDIA